MVGPSRGWSPGTAEGAAAIVKCPNCRAAEISPLTNRCELCGFAPQGLVAVEAPKAEALDDLARQELADRFALDTFLGRGADSAVFLAREHGSDRQIVVKVLARAAEGREVADERFRAAVQAVAELEHPHIVPVFDFGWTDHLYWYSMQHVRGRSLRTLLVSRGPLDLKACLRLVAQVGSALDHVHRRGMLHGALKPENVLVDADGWAHVADLMVTAALEPPSRPRPSSAPGAAPQDRPLRGPYAAPEDLRTPASDQYALALLVYECLVGSPPFDSDEVGLAPDLLLAGTRPDIPAHVTHAVRRALSRKPIDRFPGVLDFVAALETPSLAVPESRPSTPRGSAAVLRVTEWEPPVRPIGRRLAIAGAIVAAVVAGILLRPVIAGLFQPGIAHNPVPAVLAPPDTISAPPGPADTAPITPLPPGRIARSQPPPRSAASPAPSRQRTPARSQPARTPAAAPGRPAAAPAAGPQPAAPAAQGSDSGRLFVNSTPWGQLFIDGRPVGNTPKANLAVPAGPHTIRVLREGFQPYDAAITVAPGEVVRLTSIVLAARQP